MTALQRIQNTLPSMSCDLLQKFLVFGWKSGGRATPGSSIRQQVMSTTPQPHLLIHITPE